MMEIYLIRHGETDYNRQRIIQGRGVDTALNEKGRMQARAFYHHYRDIPFERIFTSTLQRTHQSVQDFIATGIPWHQHPGLDEIDWGRHEGQKTSPALREDYKRVVGAWQAGRYHEKMGGGESALQLWARQKEWASALPAYREERLLVCSHGRAMRALLCLLLDRPLSHMDQFSHANLTLYHLQSEDGKVFHLAKANDTTHLRDLALS